MTLALPTDGPAKVVVELAQAISDRDFDAVDARLAPDAVWTIVGRKDRFPFGGPQDKQTFVAGLRGFLPAFDTSFSYTVLSWAQNGPVVFLECQAEGRGPGAASYSNRYLMRFTVRDGLVTEVLEHYDPFEALVYVEQLSA